MGWKLSYTQKIRAGISFAVVFLLVLATNLIDSNHFRIVKENLATVYEDRLLAKDYLYRLSRQLQLKKEMIQNPDSQFSGELYRSLNDSIQLLIDRFATTRLTETESVHFESLQENIASLGRFENQLVSTESLVPEAPILTSSEKYFKAIYDDLDVLFKIQLEESNRVIGNSNKTIDSSNFISKIEIGVLIVIGVLIQLLIFLKPIK